MDTYTITFADDSTTDFEVTNGKGITGISKTETFGLVDTYTISYNDGSTSTFTVTNGAKGDTGDSWYVWIRYSGSHPTQDSDMGTTPDNWMGIYSGTSSTAPAHYTDYDWFQIKGEKGDKGDPSTIVSQSVTYQEGTSPNVQPSGTWTTTIPVVSQGNYLWTRTIVTFNSGNPVTFFSVARMGLDGSGSVSSVNNQSPDANGNVTVTANDIGTAGGTSVEADLSGVKNTLTQLGSAKAAKVDLTDISQTSPNCTVTNGIAKGTYFYLDGILTRAIEAISENASFTSSNCETVTAGGLNELNDYIDEYVAYQESGAITAVMNANGLYTVQSSEFPEKAGYTLVMAQLGNFNSADIKTAGVPPAVSMVGEDRLFIIGKPSATYTNVTVRGLFVKNRVK